MTPDNHKQASEIHWPIVSIGGILGLLLSWGLLKGDAQGQVNLLYLLLIYLVIPVLSLVISTVTLIFGKGVNLARLAASLPFWSRTNHLFLHRIRQLKLDKHWLFMQSQAAALAFSAASLLIFFLLLLGTDVNFVWRSTLLTAETLLPPLQWAAAPWWFWQAAQPTLDLLQATQDSRLRTAGGDVSVFYQWWPFILSTQLVYCLFLRSLLFAIARVRLQRRLLQDPEKHLQSLINRPSGGTKGPVRLAPVTDKIPEGLTVVKWGPIEDELWQQITDLPCSDLPGIHAGPLASQEAHAAAENQSGEQLLLVKAWEPPMGELADYMQKTRGFLLPLDWRDDQPVPPKQQHLEEWQRFVRGNPGWQLYQPPALGNRKQI